MLDDNLNRILEMTDELESLPLTNPSPLDVERLILVGAEMLSILVDLVKSGHVPSGWLPVEPEELARLCRRALLRLKRGDPSGLSEVLDLIVTV